MENQQPTSYYDGISLFERAWHFYKLADEETAITYLDQATDNISKWFRNCLYRKHKDYRNYKALRKLPFLTKTEQNTIIQYYLEIPNDGFIQACGGQLYIFYEKYDEALEWLQRSNDAWAIGLLGYYYTLIVKNEAIGYSYYERSALAGDATACYDLGFLCERQKDYIAAYRWYFTADQLGYFESRYRLGFLYYMGHGVKQNKDTGIRYMTAAAELGCENAQIRLFNIYNSKEQYDAAYLLAKPLAEQGNKEAMYSLRYDTMLMG